MFLSMDNAPGFFLAESNYTACHIWNRLVTSSLNEMNPTLEVMNEKEHYAGPFNRFGCSGFMNIPENLRKDRREARSEHRIQVGCHKGSVYGIFLICPPTVVEPRDV